MSRRLHLDILPPDPLLGLMQAFRADARKQKIDLGVGVYRNDQGITPVMHAVKLAEKQLLEKQRTKVYEGPSGNQAFCSSIASLVFGDQLDAYSERLCTATTPGGCGAIYLALQLMKRAINEPSVWVSDPTWPNHVGVARSLGMQVKTYSYAGCSQSGVDIESTLLDLADAKVGDVIIIQGPCHNPTGIDLNVQQWRDLANFVRSKGMIPLIDIAYHGLGTSLSRDLQGVLCALDILETACVAYSCSKNFGLYRERTGCLMVLIDENSNTLAVSSHINDIARGCYSMPPAHGAAIVQTILNSSELKSEWELELDQMRARIVGLRRSLSDRLNEVTQSEQFFALRSQNGMFSQIPLNAQDARTLINQYAIYLPSSGRLNVAGMDFEDVPRVSDAIGEFFIARR